MTSVYPAVLLIDSELGGARAPERHTPARAAIKARADAAPGAEADFLNAVLAAL